MKVALLVVEAYVPDDMTGMEASGEVGKALADADWMKLVPGHVKTLVIASPLSRKAVSCLREEQHRGDRGTDMTPEEAQAATRVQEEEDGE